MSFSAKTIELFQHRRYQGIHPEPDAVGLSGSAGRGRFAYISLSCEGNLIAEARHRTMNCVPAIAAAEWTCEWARGRAFDDIKALSADTIISALDGLPLSRKFIAQLVLDALLAAAQIARQKGLLS